MARCFISITHVLRPFVRISALCSHRLAATIVVVVLLPGELSLARLLSALAPFGILADACTFLAVDVNVNFLAERERPPERVHDDVSIILVVLNQNCSQIKCNPRVDLYIISAES